MLAVSFDGPSFTWPTFVSNEWLHMIDNLMALTLCQGWSVHFLEGDITAPGCFGGSVQSPTAINYLFTKSSQLSGFLVSSKLIVIFQLWHHFHQAPDLTKCLLIEFQ